MMLILKGNAGQGVQLMSLVLANVLKDNGYHVSMMSEYTPLMRTGDSIAKLVFSKEKIENPLVEDPDMEYDLGDDEYKDIKVKNMFLLGLIFKRLNLNYDDNIKEYLPKKFVAENLEAVKVGYNR
jgi:Pyruvate/2-oxoacid:ferredoxin oxidoreductase gamma subunit